MLASPAPAGGIAVALAQGVHIHRIAFGAVAGGTKQGAVVQFRAAPGRVRFNVVKFQKLFCLMAVNIPGSKSAAPALPAEQVDQGRFHLVVG